MDTSEKNFEASIEASLLREPLSSAPQDKPALADASTGAYLSGGYRKHNPEDYDRALCLIPVDVFDFIYATQPREWDKMQKQHGPDAKHLLLHRLASEINTRGTLEVLRKGIKANGCKFRLAYFRPASGLNEALQKLYRANAFSIVRQLKYSEKNEKSLDLGLCLNGLPIFTAELKNPFKQQNVQDGVRQYRLDRDPKEPLFGFGRCLAHFAVDPNLVYVTTHLRGAKTRFLPFNQGHNLGAGNPPSWQGFATAYLWEQVWARDSVLNLVQQFIQVVEEEDDKGNKTGELSLIFPRYQQLDVVRRLVADSLERGVGYCDLVEHSAGSGKSNTIAWLAHQLSVLHDLHDLRVFDSIIVITDRRVLDRQLQQTVRQFEQTLGVVENIDKTSRQLKQALEDGKTIIVTTLQKFPVIAKEMGALKGKKFAVIIDEAHSSQSGESTKSLKEVLSAKSLAEAEKLDAAGAEDDLEERIVAEIKSRGRLPNVSYFAFTATPKPKTLELFGRRRPDGKFEPFSLYSMRQAIEEKFILDVLENYTTYTVYWNLLKKIKDDPHYDREKTNYLLKQFVGLSRHTIDKKVAIMVEHFRENVMSRIGGKAKAMIVTPSRLHAVRYKLAVDQYLKAKGYPFRALVAFSGTVKDGGADFTETGMNTASAGKKIAEAATAETFKQKEYRLLIVANKFQTGFDQPLLHTMYVDKKLGGVNAVQTLSRLNRTHPEKEEALVLDFANEAEEIQKAFQPYYERTLLKKATDPNLLYDLHNRLDGFHLFTEAEVNQFAKIYFDPKGTQDKLHAALAPVIGRYKQAKPQEKDEFRSCLNDYNRLYAFLSQVIPFVDTDLEKLYVFAKLLWRVLPYDRQPLPVEVQREIDLDSLRVSKTGSTKIRLERGTHELDPMEAKGKKLETPPDIEPLSQIIQELNERFGTNFTEQDKVFIQQLEERIASDRALAESILVNPPEDARLTFDHVVNDRLQEMIDTNFKFYKQVTDDPEFAQFFLGFLFKRYYERKGKGQAP